ncbi:MAG: HelD family protein [Ilumatobacteraceae bacterium]
MTDQHPELAAEQAYIERAYACLEASKADALKIRELTSTGPGGTHQARVERNAFDEKIVSRLEQLEIGDSALVFGRIDRLIEGPDGTEAFHIGRLAVADESREPVVVDWRAPIAEPFYRATGRDPMGLARRRHFAVEGRTLLGIEDEMFGEGHLGIGQDDGLGGDDPRAGIRGYSTLMTALGRGRTGQLGDIVATIQSEQDEIIRSPQGGVLVVQGGPGTGKTVVALHRAAYLLYTHRFPLEDQGVLVIGPNRVFLRYIERVLPSLGEAGVDQVVLADLVDGVRVSGREPAEVARIKGQKKMAKVIDKAVSDRERPLRDDVRIPMGAQFVTLRAEETVRIVKAARRRYHRHNQARRFVENEVWAALAATATRGDTEADDVREMLRGTAPMREIFERMWPVLTPAQLLHDLYGSKALLRLAAGSHLSENEWSLLHRPRSASVDEVEWTPADVALLDEAFFQLGPRPRRNGKIDESDETRTYGHIVVDEVQDLTPMQLRMVTRRSLSGSMTIVGDIAQATGPLAPNSWDDVLSHLPTRKEPRVVGLSVGYRIPSQIMALADKVMLAATPGLRAPRSVRDGESDPRVESAPDRSSLMSMVAGSVRDIRSVPGAGRVAVICADATVDDVSAALTAAGVSHGSARTTGLDNDVSIVPASVAKGLEIDNVVVVEPAEIVADDPQGLRLLYVCLTRSTQTLTVLHHAPLPAAMR